MQSIFPRVSTNGNSLYRSLKFAVQHGRNIFRLWDCDCSFFRIHTAMLGAKETLPVLTRFEAWKTYSLGVTEKIGAGCIEIAQSTLQRLGINLRQPFMLSLQFTLHQIGQIYVAERFLTFLVCRDFQIQSPIIDKTAAAESLCEQDLLFFRRIDSILVGT